MAKAKLGIRPIIDGRWGGVRESLEEKTMNMALAAKKLIEENVFYSDGTPFECIISPCTIGGAAEAAKCADFFSTQNVCATLSVTPCWCYGSETMDLDPLTVKAVWGFNGTERPGALTRREVCPRSPSTARMFRMSPTTPSPTTSRRRYSVSHAAPRLSVSSEASPTSA